MTFPYFYQISRELNQVAIYDFDPKLPKKASPIIGKAELEENGSNLSIVLKEIRSSEEKTRTLLNLLRTLLPFVEELDVGIQDDRSLLFKLRETYSKNIFPLFLSRTAPLM